MRTVPETPTFNGSLLVHVPLDDLLFLMEVIRDSFDLSEVLPRVVRAVRSDHIVEVLELEEPRESASLIL
jgi:hypothetical protein